MVPRRGHLGAPGAKAVAKGATWQYPDNRGHLRGCIRCEEVGGMGGGEVLAVVSEVCAWRCRCLVIVRWLGGTGECRRDDLTPPAKRWDGQCICRRTGLNSPCSLRRRHRHCSSLNRYCLSPHLSLRQYLIRCPSKPWLLCLQGLYLSLRLRLPSHTAHSPANYPAFLHPPIIPAASPRSRIAVFLSARLLRLASHAPSFGTVVSAPVHVRRRYRRPTPHWPALPVPERLRVIGTVWRAALDGGGLGGRSQWTVRVLGRRFWTWAWIWWVRGVAEWWRRPWEAGS